MNGRMKTDRKCKPLTLGDLIAAVYHIVGKHRAPGMMRLAINAHVVGFRGHRHGVSS